jgi:hypothetical protein
MNTELTTTQPIEGVILHQQSQAVALAGAVLDKRIATAKQWPRSISRFKQQASELLSEDIETARSAEYSKPVGGGFVRGPSVRLAEIACLCWGNVEVSFDEPIVGDKSVIVNAYAWDLERNIRVPGIATMSIVNKNGQRYPQHMVETTIMACAAKARRNAVLTVIPRAYVNDLLETAREVASKNAPPLEETRQKMLDHFARSHRVSAQQVFAYLSVAGADDIGQDQISELRGVVEAIKDGEPVEAFFGDSKSKAEAAREAALKRKSASEEKAAQ